jgi:hypothetical protein
VALRFSRSHPQARFPALPDFTGSGSPRPRFPALPGFSHLLLHYRPHLRAPGLTAPLSHPVSMLYLGSPAPVPPGPGFPLYLVSATFFCITGHTSAPRALLRLCHTRLACYTWFHRLRFPGPQVLLVSLRPRSPATTCGHLPGSIFNDRLKKVIPSIHLKIQIVFLRIQEGYTRYRRRRSSCPYYFPVSRY